MLNALPKTSWCRTKATVNMYGAELPRKTWRILAAYIVGSEAKGTARPDSDLDIALVVERRCGKPAKLDSIKLTQYYHMNFRHEHWKPTWEGRIIDFQFFYPGELERANYSMIPLQ